MTFERYEAMLAEQGLQMFHREPWANPETGKADARVLGERPRLRWRVSSDEWDKLVAYANEKHGWTSIDTTTYLGGFPIRPDDLLPPRSIVLEPYGPLGEPLWQE